MSTATVTELRPMEGDGGLVDELAEAIVARLGDELVDRLADVLREKAAPVEEKPVRIGDVCKMFGMSAEWVRANAETLGGFRDGDGPKARLLFFPSTAGTAWAARPGSTTSRTRCLG